jgi:hypothetical protein
MSLRELDEGALARANEILGRAAHDVAKYMAITARNVDAAPGDCTAADLLRRDLVRTDGQRPAWELWRVLSQSLAELGHDEDVRAVDEGMERLAALVDQGTSDVGTLARLAVEVADRILALNRSVRRRLREGRP